MDTKQKDIDIEAHWKYFNISSLRYSFILTVVTFFLLIHVSALTWCQAARIQNTSNITTHSNTPWPKQQVYNSWVRNFFETEEIWRFKSKAEFESFVDSSSMDLTLKVELKSLYRDQLTHDEAVKAIIHYDVKAPGGFVMIPQELRNRIPKSVVEQAYSYLFKNFGLKPGLYVQFESSQEVESFLNANKFSLFAKEIALRNTILLDGKFLLLITPHLWSDLPEGVRRELVSSQLHPAPNKLGIKATLLVRRSDDLFALASKYAGERDPRPIERYLKQTLGQSESVEIQVEKIMHPFIRKMIDTYPECHGPNCFNSGLNVNRGHSFKVEHVATDSDLMEEACMKYRFVTPAEPLQAGDILIYKDTNNNVIHVSTYIDEGIVFTKNGLNRFNPYIFQDRSQNEKIYFPDGKYKLIAMRVPKSGEKPAGLEGYYTKNHIFYRIDPDLEYGEIKFNPTKSRMKRAQRLRKLSSDWVTNSQMKELIRLRDDPRVADMRAEIQAIISQNLKLEKVRGNLMLIEFNPFGSVTKNNRALTKLLKQDKLGITSRETLEWIYDTHRSEYGPLLSKLEKKFSIDFEASRARAKNSVLSLGGGVIATEVNV